MSTPCAACKYLRRKCTEACVFAPYFPANKLDDYAAVHKVFGANQVTKIVNDIHPSQRQDAMTSLVYEAQTHLNDPVFGCSLHIHNLQRQLKDLEVQLQIARNDLARYSDIVPPLLDLPPPVTYQQNQIHNTMMMPGVSSYGGALTSQRLQEETHQTHTDAAQSKRDDCP